MQDLLFSPKGGIEGFLLKMKGELVQVSMPAELGAVLAETRVRRLHRPGQSARPGLRRDAVKP